MTIEGIDTGISKELDPEEWHSARAMTIGGSEIASCIPGGNKYTTPAQLWERKLTGAQKRMNANMLVGVRLQDDIEAAAIAKIRMTYPDAKKIAGSESLWKAKHAARLTCTPDLIMRSEEADLTIVCEHKTTTNYNNRWAQRIESRGRTKFATVAPKDAIYQLAHTMNVLASTYNNPEFDWGFARKRIVGYLFVMPIGMSPPHLREAEELVEMIGPFMLDHATSEEMWKYSNAMLECLDTKTRPGLDDIYSEEDPALVGLPDATADIARSLDVTATPELQKAYFYLKEVEEVIKPELKKIDEIKDQIKSAIKRGGGDRLVSEDGEVLANYKAHMAIKWRDFCDATGTPYDADFHESLMAHLDVLDNFTERSQSSRRLYMK